MHIKKINKVVGACAAIGEINGHNRTSCAIPFVDVSIRHRQVHVPLLFLCSSLFFALLCYFSYLVLMGFFTVKTFQISICYSN